VCLFQFLAWPLAFKERERIAMRDIRLIDLIGPDCIDSHAGLNLRDQLHEILKRGETVCLDFSGVTTLAGSFLATAVGGLYECFGKDDLDRRLHWKGLDPTDDAVMRLVQRNAIRFYSAGESVREALLSSSVRAGEE
jgi:STAS-like domain of unknown function (DUF4325)